MGVVLLDLDPIVYRSGFAAQKTLEGGVVEAEPVANALHNAKVQIEEILSATRADAYVGYLSGSKNFRNAIAKLKPYKGNRDPSHKPVHYAALREYLVDRWGAKVTDGIEADDALSIEARDGGAVVIASIDKDLDQIPGHHYNYLRKEFYAVSVKEAEMFFYRQVLTGDRVDNIGGCWKVGQVKAAKILDGYNNASVPNWREIWLRVIDCYKESQFVPGCPYTELEAADVALENAQLVKLQEYEGHIWQPPK